MQARNIWIMADTHFYHNSLVTRGYRPFNYNKLILDNWKRQAKENDIIIHLGDVILKSGESLKSILSTLPGRKILTRGNHDGKSNNWYMDNGFDFVCDSFTWNNVIFSHRPMQLPPGIEYNIHGHLHDNSHRFKEEGIAEIITKNHLLISLERLKYHLITLNKVLEKSGDFSTLNIMEEYNENNSSNRCK